MRIRANEKFKAAVKIAAALFITIFIVVWAVFAFLTINDVGTYDFSQYTTTKLIAGEERTDDEEIYGIAFRAEEGKCAEKLKKIVAAKKVPFVILSGNKKEEIALAEECMRQLSGSRIVFCSENREALEFLLTEREAFYCIRLCSTSTEAFFTTKMGYNCALSLEKIKSETVERAHEQDHFFVATGVKDERDVENCKRLKVDYAFLNAGI